MVHSNGFLILIKYFKIVALVFYRQVLQIENLDYQLDLSVNDVQQLCSARIKAKNAKAVADLAEKKYATLLTRLGFMNYINVDEDY